MTDHKLYLHPIEKNEVENRFQTLYFKTSKNDAD